MHSLPRLWRAALVGLILALLLVTAYLVFSRDPEGEPSRRQPSAPSSADIQFIETSAVSRDLDLLRATFGVPASQRLNPDFVSEQRRWRELAIEPSSFQARGTVGGTVEAELIVRNRSATRWLLGIERAPDGTWFIASTEVLP